MQSATPFSSSASVSMEQSINNYSLFSKETENKRSFTSDKVEFSHYICPKKSKNWLKNTTLEYIYKLSSPQRKKFQWQLLQKKQFHQNSYKTLSPKKSEVKTNEMQKSQPPLHIKNPQKNSLQHQKSKTIETKICKEVDGVRKFTTNPYRRFRSKQTRLALHDESKNYVNTTSHKYVAKTESQKRPPYLHIATGHSKFLICISNSGAIDKHFFTFSEGKIKQTQFYIWQGRVFTLHV